MRASKRLACENTLDLPISIPDEKNDTVSEQKD